LISVAEEQTLVSCLWDHRIKVLVEIVYDLVVVPIVSEAQSGLRLNRHAIRLVHIPALPDPDEGVNRQSEPRTSGHYPVFNSKLFFELLLVVWLDHIESSDQLTAPEVGLHKVVIYYLPKGLVFESHRVEHIDKVGSVLVVG
jgi:hypothetical protein